MNSATSRRDLRPTPLWRRALLLALATALAGIVYAQETWTALLVTLAPGNYTALVSGANGTSGVALVEVYEVP